MPPRTGAMAVSPAMERPTLREVYDAHWEFVWRALRAHGVREADLEDQTHEVFLVVQRKLSEFEGRSRITTWLFSIAARVASDWRRRAHVRRERPSEVPADEVPSGDASGEDVVARRQARAALEWILDEMSAEQRVVFSLFELDGLSAEEIAPLVGASPNTVYSRLRLARRHFERSLTRLRARGEW